MNKIKTNLMPKMIFFTITLCIQLKIMYGSHAAWLNVSSGTETHQAHYYYPYQFKSPVIAQPSKSVIYQKEQKHKRNPCECLSCVKENKLKNVGNKTTK